MSRQTPESQEPAEDELTEDAESSENEFETDDENGQTQTTEKAKFTPFSAGVYRALALSVLIGGGVGTYGYIKSHSNPDTRTPEEMTRAYLNYRAKMAPKAVGEITDDKVKAIALNAVCLLNQMGHPQGDNYDPSLSKDPSAPKKKDYKRETDDFFFDKHDPRTPRKYVYRNNIYGYVLEDTPKNAEATIIDLARHPDTKDFMKWFTWEPKVFLEQPLECVRNVEGSCIKTWDDSDCLLVSGLAQAVTLANVAMHEAKKGQIMPMVCYRNDLHQAVAFVANSGKGCKEIVGRPGLMLPGNSFHGLGLAMDLANQGEAEDFLAEFGIACGFIKGDEGHCSFGEQTMNGNLKSKLKRKLQKWKGRWNDVKDGWKVWKKR